MGRVFRKMQVLKASLGGFVLFKMSNGFLPWTVSPTQNLSKTFTVTEKTGMVWKWVPFNQNPQGSFS